MRNTLGYFISAGDEWLHGKRFRDGDERHAYAYLSHDNARIVLRKYGDRNRPVGTVTIPASEAEHYVIL